MSGTPIATRAGVKRAKPIPPVKSGRHYKQLWRGVDGAVRDCFHHHPDYLTPKGINRSTARQSIVKRVTGAVLGFANVSMDAGARVCVPALSFWAV